MLIKTLLPVVALAASVQAQTIYEPINVQYGGQNAYYYAGTDQRIHAAAAFPSAVGAAWGRTGGYAFVSAHRAVVERTPRIFTDALGSFDARVYGMTVDDVVNEANARVPRYFKKLDLINAATPREKTMVVSPYAPAVQPQEKGSIIIKPWSGPLFRRGPVFVVPKGLMDKKLPSLSTEKRV